MSRAETFIQEHTKNCSNEIERNVDGLLSYLDYVPWLTPDQTRRAVEIAREEMIEKAAKWLSKLSNYNAELFIQHILVQ